MAWASYHIGKDFVMQAQECLILVVSWSKNDIFTTKTNLSRKAIFNPECYPDIACCTAAEMFVAAWDEDRR